MWTWIYGYKFPIRRLATSSLMVLYLDNFPFEHFSAISWRKWHAHHAGQNRQIFSLYSKLKFLAVYRRRICRFAFHLHADLNFTKCSRWQYEPARATEFSLTWTNVHIIGDLCRHRVYQPSHDDLLKCYWIENLDLLFLSSNKHLVF